MIMSNVSLSRQIIKENSEILDKILRSKAGSESIEDEEDVTEGGGDTVILLEGQQHEDQVDKSNLYPTTLVPACKVHGCKVYFWMVVIKISYTRL